MNLRMSRRGILIGAAALAWGRGAAAADAAAPQDPASAGSAEGVDKSKRALAGGTSGADTGGPAGANKPTGAGATNRADRREPVGAGPTDGSDARDPAGTRSANGAGSTARASGVGDRIAALEKREGGRLGVFALDTATGRHLDHRGGERFAMCSTFKFLAAAAILRRVDRGKDNLDRQIEYGQADLLEYAPVSKEHVKEGRMVLADVCSAAVEWSDNTAANLLLQILGGPQGLTAFIRTLGDNVTRLDRNEPSLNVVGPGEEHDTSTAAAMVGLLSTVLFGQALSPDSRSRLEGWMLDAKVGPQRIPAGLPPGWRIAHKTGTWSNQTNDVGVVWPPNRAPIVVAAFYSRSDTPQEQREGVLRDVGRIIAAGI
jgi:beta-lactamase class A